MSAQIKRVPTGIAGFDKLISGGFPENFVVLLAGTPGTGKSIFSLEYLYNGASVFNEKGVYITLEQPVEDLKKQALQFGWDFDVLEQEGKVIMKRIDALSVEETVKAVAKIVHEVNAKRLVVDSLSGMKALISIQSELLSQVSSGSYSGGDSAIRIVPDKDSSRKVIWDVFRKFKDMNCTIMIPSEAVFGAESFSSDGISEFACDGIILLKKLSMGREEVRTVSVEKMRITRIDGGTHDLEFTENGIVIGE